ncbi:MAG: DUF5011 domain-containing protein, partial [Candidatus Hydrogenedentes bacterium]|nr:DUF5011 domain-containing protein [Candidatus Hydrogenedentota bacterium]
MSFMAYGELLGSDWSYGSVSAEDVLPSVVGVGDVTADGYNDFIITDPSYASRNGKVMLWTGGEEGLSDIPAWQCTAGPLFPDVDIRLGSGVESGDINGDGINDLAIGATNYRNSISESYNGGVLVWYGGTDTFNTDSTADAAHWVGRTGPEQGFAYLGETNAVVDVNGDGFADVFSSAPFAFKEDGYSGGGVFGWYSSESGANGGESGWTDNSDWFFEPLFSRQAIGGGQGVAFAGDLDGDGYDDLVVTAYHYSTNGSGEVFIFRGGPSGLSTTADWYFKGSTTNAAAGLQAHYAGDLNGDGYDDFVVGSRGVFDTDVCKHSILVWYGGADFFAAAQVYPDDADWTYTFPAATNQYPQRVTLTDGGDITGNGYSDLFWASNQYSLSPHDYHGQLLIHEGGPAGLGATPAYEFTGVKNRGFLGKIGGIIGDIDGNGCADYAYSLGEDAVTIHVTYGGPIMPSMEKIVIDGDEGAGTGMNQAGRTGTHVAEIGDVNADGFGDMMIGTPGHDTGFGEDAGRVDIYYGKDTGFAAAPDLTLTIPDDVISEYWARFGISGGRAGDVDGDGYDDVVISADYSESDNYPGRVYLYSGGATGLNIEPVWVAEGTAAKSMFGFSTGGTGDVNGDGYADIFVTEYKYANGEPEEGRILVYHGSAMGLGSEADWIYESDEANVWLGYSAAWAGDTNGDGYSDLVVGLPYADYDGKLDTGRVYVFHGSSDGLGSIFSTTHRTGTVGARIGWSVAGADLDGDGYSDLLLGAPTRTNWLNEEGYVYVHYGSTGGAAQNSNWSVRSNKSSAHLGWSVARAGDVNGDGLDDAIFGSPGYNDTGAVFLWYGSTTRMTSNHESILNHPDKYLVFESTQNGAEMGGDVASAGDATGDGTAGILIGMPGYDVDAVTDAGRVRILYNPVEASYVIDEDFIHYGYLGDVYGNASWADFRRNISLTWSNTNQQGSWSFHPHAPLQAFTAAYDQYIGEGTGADGMCFVYQANANKSFGEQGVSGADGLVVTFRTYTDNISEIKYNGAVLNSVSRTDLRTDSWIPVEVRVDKYGRCTVQWNGITLHNAVQLPDWSPQEDWYMGMGARTGNSTDKHMIDNFHVDTSYIRSTSDRPYRYRPLRYDGTPISYLGFSDSYTGFKLSVIGGAPQLSSRMAIEVEVKPFGISFDGTGTLISPFVTPVSGNTTVVEVPVEGLDPGTRYHWRARSRSMPIAVDTPVPGKSAWVSPPNRGNRAAMVSTQYDLEPPTITLLGDAELTWDVLTAYTDPGATAFDTFEGDLTAQIIVANTVDADVVGVYTVTYNITDASGNRAIEVIRTVTIADRVPPVITITGDNPLEIDVNDGVYNDPGATADDNYDGDITGSITVENLVEPTVTGSYTVTYNVEDASGNLSSAVRSVIVRDYDIPTIELLGDVLSRVPVFTVDCYTELGANAYDNYDDNAFLSTQIVITGTVDCDIVFDYPITYTVVDSSGNPAEAVTRTVQVYDDAAPEITVLGTNPITVPQNVPYVDAGASALDIYEGDISPLIVTTNQVDTDTVGTYTVIYTVSDGSGNEATPKIRTVFVGDQQNPVIHLTGANPQQVELGDTYVEPGYQSHDSQDGDITASVVVTGVVDTGTVGSYQRTYTVQDSNTNTAEKIRTVEVVYEGSPDITLLGDNPYTAPWDVPYEEPGAVAWDELDGELTASIVIDSSSVDTGIVGSYEVTYDVQNSLAVPAVQQVRTVLVADTESPVLALVGETPMTLALGDAYVEPGATALDNFDGDVSASIVTTGTVNVDVFGVYSVVYTVTDSSGNTATAKRTVYVRDELAEAAQDTWNLLPDPPANDVRDMAFDINGTLWLVAGEPLTHEWQTNTEVIGDEIRHYERLDASASENALLCWRDEVWTVYTPEDIGVPGAWITSVSVSGTDVYVGTSTGLVLLNSDTFPPETTVNTMTEGLVGNWVSDVDADPLSGMVWVAHQGSVFYRLHETAVKRFWESPGGVSVWNGVVWTAFAASRDNYGHWETIRGAQISSVHGLTGGLFRTGTEEGISLFSGSSWQYETLDTGMPGVPVNAMDTDTVTRLWMATGSGAAFMRDRVWTTFTAENSVLPANEVDDLLVTAAGDIWFATAGGLASYTPDLLVWRLYTEAGAGSARALTTDISGSLWAALKDIDGVVVMQFVPEVAVALLAPEDESELLSDETGILEVPFSWEPVPGAQSYDLVIDGEFVQRVDVNAVSYLLESGTHTWSVRAVFSNGVAGPEANYRTVTIINTQMPDGAEFFLIHETPIVPGDRYVFNYYWNGENWREALLAPGYEQSPSDAVIDLAGSKSRNLVSAWWNGNMAGLEQYPASLPVPFADLSSEEPMRVDITSEPGGYMMFRNVPHDGYQSEIRMYQKISGDEQSSFLLAEGIEVVDVAGLDYGRIAVMEKSGAARVIRQYEREAYNCVPDHLPDEDATLGGGVAMTALAGGGYAVLMDTQLVTFDSEGSSKTFDLNSAYLQANCTPMFAKDLA